jgi:hypothetical protein
VEEAEGEIETQSAGLESSLTCDFRAHGPVTDEGCLAAWRATAFNGYNATVGYAPALEADVACAMAGCRGVVPAEDEAAAQQFLFWCVFGPPGVPLPLVDPVWCTETVLSLAKQMYDSRDFGAMPILADALQDAGCDNEDILDHCRGPGPHVRGCWVVDLVLGKS